MLLVNNWSCNKVTITHLKTRRTKLHALSLQTNIDIILWLCPLSKLSQLIFFYRARHQHVWSTPGLGHHHWTYFYDMLCWYHSYHNFNFFVLCYAFYVIESRDIFLIPAVIIIHRHSLPSRKHLHIIMNKHLSTLIHSTLSETHVTKSHVMVTKSPAYVITTR